MTAKPKLRSIAIVGSTASGKTAAAVELSKLMNIEIISADSRQIYKYFDIGTAKPDRDELDSVKHHFIDFLDPAEAYSAGRFAEEALLTANDIFEKGKIPVIAGGSGFYVQALCEGFFKEEKPEEYDEIRKSLSKRLKQEGIESLFSELQKVDAASAEKYTDRNPRRVLRALEYFHAYGSPFSSAQTKQHTKPFFDTVYYGIYHDREKLYERINRRAELMWKSGLAEETKRVLEMGYSPDLNALNTVGYKEAAAYLKGSISAGRALVLIKQNTRRYAKRQMTWFRKNKNIKWIEGSASEIAGQIRKDF